MRIGRFSVCSSETRSSPHSRRGTAASFRSARGRRGSPLLSQYPLPPNYEDFGFEDEWDFANNHDPNYCYDLDNLKNIAWLEEREGVDPKLMFDNVYDFGEALDTYMYHEAGGAYDEDFFALLKANDEDAWRWLEGMFESGTTLYNFYYGMPISHYMSERERRDRDSAVASRRIHSRAARRRLSRY